MNPKHLLCPPNGSEVLIFSSGKSALKETYHGSLREQRKHIETSLTTLLNCPDAEVLSSQSAAVEIDPQSVVDEKSQSQGKQELSKRTLSAMLGIFILIMSAGLLVGLIRVG